MTAREFLTQQAEAHGYITAEGFYGDIEFKPVTSKAIDGAELIELCARLDRKGYEVAIAIGGRLQIRAPHVKRHDWDRSRGLDCDHGVSMMVCDALHRCDSSMEELQAGIL